ncbi:MAG: replication factor C small subunit [Thermoplasmata archaeon]
MMEVWVEKYRPKTLSEVVGNKEIVEKLQSYAKIKNMPHLIFAGPPGVGKTTCALALVKDLYGNDWGLNFMELNASDERGIDVVRKKIKDFARTSVIHGFKILFLDEADALTSDAQSALRRTMEKYSNNCRFILSCNYSSKIIEAIQSRCAVFRFNSINEEELIAHLKDIAKKEGKHVTEEAYKDIAKISEGDMRKAINILQMATSVSKEVTRDDVYKVTGSAHPSDVKEMILNAIKGNFIESRKKLDDIIAKQGVSGDEVLRAIHTTVLDMPDINEGLLLKIIDKIGEIDFRIVEGSSDRIQLEALLAYLAIAKEDKI